jgi:hypothetical protein
MAVPTVNLIIEKGTDFDEEISLKDTNGLPFNLTGYNIIGKIRKHRESQTSLSFNIATPDRTNGVIELSLPRWLSASLQSGRYVYDVIVISSTNISSIVIQGDILIEGLISQTCTFILPTSAQRLCIAVVDENDGTQTFAGMYEKWAQFRSTYPNRTFYLLQPTPIGCCGTDSALGTGFGSLVDNNTYATLHCPDNFLNETTVNVSPLI